jgi:hypothetical protein
LKRRIEILVIAILLLNMITALAMAGVASEPHVADAMWVEPSSVTFDVLNASVGQKFNVTVWLNMTEDLFSYQIAMHYNRTLLKCTQAKFTAGGTSNYFSGHATVSPTPNIDTSSAGNGSILACEACLGDDFVAGPHSESLIWAEFQILTVSSAGTYTSKFDISKDYLPNGAGDTWITDPSGVIYLEFTPYDGNYSIVPEFSYLLILPIFVALTTLALAYSKKTYQKKPN